MVAIIDGVLSLAAVVAVVVVRSVVAATVGQVQRELFCLSKDVVIQAAAPLAADVVASYLSLYVPMMKATILDQMVQSFPLIVLVMDDVGVSCSLLASTSIMLHVLIMTMLNLDQMVQSVLWIILVMDYVVLPCFFVASS